MSKNELRDFANELEKICPKSHQTLDPMQRDLSLERMHALLNAMGSPQRHLPPVVHLAGTNGKGSTLAFLEAIFIAKGFTVQSYISPELIDLTDRIRINTINITPEDYVHALRVCISKMGDIRPTYFEITTAAAFLYFSQASSDVLILETGLGGRLDATNVVENPVMTIITTISLDHQDYLGSSIEQIAAEKAGIMKTQVPYIVGKVSKQAISIIEERARTTNSRVIVCGRDWHLSKRDNLRYLSHKGSEYKMPELGLVGEHQFHNAACAMLAIANMPQFGISLDKILDGRLAAKWPARLQLLTHGPLLSGLPAATEIWLDGGHNPAAGEVLAQHFQKGNRHVTVIIGMLANKDIPGFMAFISEFSIQIYAIAIPNTPNSASPEQIVAAGLISGAVVRPMQSLELAIDKAVKEGPSDQQILICGSLYLAGYVLQRNG